MKFLRIALAITIILLAYALWFSVGIFGIIGGLMILDVPGGQIIGLVITIAGFVLTLRYVGKIFRRLTRRQNIKVEKF